MIKKGSLVLIQYPHGCGRIALKAIPILQKRKHVRFVFLLHDIDSLRGYNSNRSGVSEKVMSFGDYLICHNDKMKRYLLSMGIKEEKLYTLGVFDYLYDGNPICAQYGRTVALAGNLSPRKSPYIDMFLKMDKTFYVNVYGPNYPKGEKYINTNYRGEFGPEEIPLKICENWGLVWDGDSLESCTGETGNYLRYNNPHKLSLYVASEIPVIVWNESALADYVLEKKIGITVSSLYEIENKISGITEDEYSELVSNVKKESRHMRDGQHFNAVMNAIEEQH